MKFPLSLLLATALPAFAADPPADPKQATSGPEAKAAAWLKSLGEGGLVIDEHRKHPEDAGFIGQAIAGSKNTMFVLSDHRYHITLGFEGTVTEDTSLETLREKFSYIALDKLPTPGLEIPGWEITPRTPVSSIGKVAGAVEILAAGENKITFRVKTSFFALSGRALKVLVPADAALPEGSYFQIREPFELDLNMVSRFVMGK